MLSRCRILGVFDGLTDGDKASFDDYSPQNVYGNNQYYRNSCVVLHFTSLAETEFGSGLRTIVNDLLLELAEPDAGGPE